MYRMLLILLISFCTNVAALDLLWQTEAVLKTPESLLFNYQDSLFYISNINSAPSEKDGNGFISRIDLQGKIIDLQWVKGLNAPKGSVIVDSIMFVTDIDVLVEIDITRAQIIKRYPAADAQFLNDVIADDAGVIYVSDSSGKNSAIYRLTGEKLEKWLDTQVVSRPNGLYYSDKLLYIGNSGTTEILAVDITDKKTIKKIAVGSAIDGLRGDGRGGFIVSDWKGKVSHIDVHGKTIVLLDDSAKNINAADLEFISEKNMLLIPTFFDNRIRAFNYKIE